MQASTIRFAAVMGGGFAALGLGAGAVTALSQHESEWTAEKRADTRAMGITSGALLAAGIGLGLAAARVPVGGGELAYLAALSGGLGATLGGIAGATALTHSIRS